jgi:hypothetical protein
LIKAFKIAFFLPKHKFSELDDVAAAVFGKKQLRQKQNETSNNQSKVR